MYNLPVNIGKKAFYAFFLFLILGIFISGCGGKKGIRIVETPPAYISSEYTELPKWFWETPDSSLPFAVGFAGCHSDIKMGYRKAKLDAVNKLNKFAMSKVKGGYAERVDNRFILDKSFAYALPVSEIYTPETTVVIDSFKNSQAQIVLVIPKKYNYYSLPDFYKEIIRIDPYKKPEWLERIPNETYTAKYAVGFAEKTHNFALGWEKSENRGMLMLLQEHEVNIQNLDLFSDDDFYSEVQSWRTMEAEGIVGDVLILERYVYGNSFLVLLKKEF